MTTQVNALLGAWAWVADLIVRFCDLYLFPALYLGIVFPVVLRFLTITLLIDTIYPAGLFQRIQKNILQCFAHCYDYTGVMITQVNPRRDPRA